MITSLGAPITAAGMGDSTPSEQISGLESLESMTDSDTSTESGTITVDGTLTQHNGDAAANDTIVLLNFETDELRTTETDSNGSFAFEDVEADTPHALEYYQGDWRGQDDFVEPQEELPRDGVPHFTALGTLDGSSDVTIDETLPEAHELTVRTVDDDGTPVSAHVSVGHNAPSGEFGDLRQLSHSRGELTDDNGYYRLPNQNQSGLELGGEVTVEQAGELRETFDPIDADETVEFTPSEVGLSAHPTPEAVGEEIRFELFVERDLIETDGEITGGGIEFGDGTAMEFDADDLDNRQSVVHTYDEPGDYVADFTVTTLDSDDEISTYNASTEVEVFEEESADDGSSGGDTLEQSLLLDRGDVELWDQAPLPLRVDTDGATETIQTAGRLQAAIDPALVPLNKEKIGIFDTHSPITFGYDLSRTSGEVDDKDFSDTDVQLVVEEVDSNIGNAKGYQVFDDINGEDLRIDEDGELSVDIELDSGGQYLVHVVAIEDDQDRFFLADDGSLVTDGTPEIVGMDHLAVQAEAGEITVPDGGDVPLGGSFEVDVTAPIDAEEGVDHALIVYDNSTIEDSAVTISLDPDDVSADSVSIEHDIVAVNGVADIDESITVIDRAGTLQGTFTAGSVLDIVADQAGVDSIENVSTDDLVLDASMASVGDTGSNATLTVETLPSWETGNYELLYLAQQGDDTRTLSTATDSVEVKFEAAIDSDFSPAEEDSDAYQDPELDDGEVPTEVTFDASASIGAVESYEWDFNGNGTIDQVTEDPVVNHTYTEPERFFPSVTIRSAENRTDSAEKEIELEDNTPPEVTLSGPETVNIDERFQFEATVSDNHLVESVTWNITDTTFPIEVIQNEMTEVNAQEAIVPFETSLGADEVDPDEQYRVVATAEDAEGNDREVDFLFDVVDEELEVALDVDVGDPEVPANVTFDASDSTGPIAEYQWDFTGDGEIDRITTGQAVVEHTYTEPGEFEPEVTIVSSVDETETDSASAEPLEIVDTTPPEVELDGPEEVSPSEQFELKANVSDNHLVDEVTWTITDEGDTEVQTETIDVNAPKDVVTLNTSIDTEGNYTAALEAVDPSDNVGSDSIEFEVADRGPQAVLADVDEQEVPAEVSFDASGSTSDVSIVSYEWDFDDNVNNVTTEEPSATHEYTEPGTYEPTVTVTDSEDRTDTASIALETVDTTPPEVDLTDIGEVDLDREFTLDATVTDNHQVDTVTWTITDEDGAIVESETLDDPTEEPSFTTSIGTEGTYTATLTAVDASGNVGNDSTEFEVVALPNLVTTIDAESEQRLQDGLSANVTVENVGPQSTEDGVAVDVNATGTPFGASGSIDLNDSRDIGELGPEESTTFEVDLTEWAQDNRVVGDVNLTAEADPDGLIDESTTETNLATDEIDVTYVNLEADAVARNGIEGQEITLRSFVANEGTATSDGDRTADVTVINSTDDTVAEHSIPISELAPGEQERNRTTVVLDEAGNYEMEVEIGDEDLFPEGNIANANFVVEEYRLDFDAESTRVPSEVERGSEFSVAFRYDTNSRAAVNASLDLPSEIEFADTEDETKQLNPQRDRLNTVRWNLVANETSEQDLDLSATIEDTLDLGVEDTTVAATSVPVRTERFTDRNATVLQGNVPDGGQDGETEANSTIEIRNETTYEQELTISVQGDSEGRTLQGLEYLVRYPYGCVEQTTSAFLGALNTKQYYEDRDGYDLQEQNPDRFDRINASIEKGVQDLNETGVRGQKSDGSWNMWGSDFRSGETFYTAYALFGLSSVEQDPDYSAELATELDGVDFDRTIVWLNETDQNADGSFDARWYIQDKNAMTGFTMLTVDETLAHDRTEDDGVAEDNATALYKDAADYLVDEQTANGAWEARLDESATSTALAIWGLQTALDNLDDFEDMDTNEDEIETAIADGHQWLLDEQDEDGSWSNYQNSPFWNAQGDASEEAAFAALALNETIETADDVSETIDTEDSQDTIENATRFLTTVYEDEGSWGYPRATALAIDALQELTSEVEADRTVTVTIDGNEDFKFEFEIDENNPEESIELDADDLKDLRDGDTTKTVEIDTGVDDAGLIIVAIENDQVVDRDEFEGGA